MLKKVTLVVMLFALSFMVACQGSSGHGDKAKATGEIMVFKNDAWLHWFNFIAKEIGDEPHGSGDLTHQRLNDEGTEVLREEHSLILYVLVEGNEAWFTGPIVYDSENPDPTGWFVVYVFDGGQPSGDNDLIWFDRVENEDEALELLGTYSWGTYPPDDLEDGNLEVSSH